MNDQKYIWLFLVIVTFSFGCSNNKVFEEYREMDKFSWNRFNILKFEVPVDDTESEFDIYIAIRHLPEFPYKQLPVNLTIYSPSGEMRSANQTLSLYDKAGNSLSECLGDFCDISVVVRKEFKFSEQGIYKFRIENKWKKVDLPGIMEVGLIVEKSKNR